jgi:carotenoid 1,2-hydratase
VERGLRPTERQNGDAWPVSGRGRGPSWGGRADGGPIGTIGGKSAPERPRFSTLVPPRGYAWWYVDALSDDGQFGLTVIAFIGSVFSPYYAWSGHKRPQDHCAFNVALYGKTGHRWAMTERHASALHQSDDAISIGPSQMAWDGQALTLSFDETTCPIPSRLKGTVRLHPHALTRDAYELAPHGGHLWRPIAPRATVEVTLDHPACTWRGEGYFDTNSGLEPLEDGFDVWDWSRVHRAQDSLIFYDVTRRRDGEREPGDAEAGLALRIARCGEVERIEAPPRHRLPATGWRLPRTTRGEPDAPPSVRKTLEDAPFYARSLLDGRYGGEPAAIMHESLSLQRFRLPIVQAVLPFRMPRTLW